MAYIEREALFKFADAIEQDFLTRNERPAFDLDGIRYLAQQLPAADVSPVVRCRECKHRNKQKCPLVMVRFDMKPNGKMKKVLEQNYVDEEFWCKDGTRMDGE